MRAYNGDEELSMLVRTGPRGGCTVVECGVPYRATSPTRPTV